MTIEGWFTFVAVAVPIIICCIFFTVVSKTALQKTRVISITVVLVAAILGGFLWFFHGTGKGERALIDEKSDLQNGLDRVINVYTADGDLLAHYEGKIDISDADGYVKFDMDGKRYIYYNCYVESIADID